MPRMPAERVGFEVTLGPCPGCFCWQLEYNLNDFASVELLYEVVEDALQDHLDECPGLQEIVDSP